MKSTDSRPQDPVKTDSILPDSEALSISIRTLKTSKKTRNRGDKKTSGTQKEAADKSTAAPIVTQITDKNRLYDAILQAYCAKNGLGLLRYCDSENCHFTLIESPLLFFAYPGCDNLMLCDTKGATEAAELLAAYFRIPDRKAARKIFKQVTAMAAVKPAGK